MAGHLSVEDQLLAETPSYMVIATLVAAMQLIVAAGFGFFGYQNTAFVILLTGGIPYGALCAIDAIRRERRRDELEAEAFAAGIQAWCRVHERSLELDRRNAKLQGDLDALHFIGQLLARG